MLSSLSVLDQDLTFRPSWSSYLRSRVRGPLLLLVVVFNFFFADRLVSYLFAGALVVFVLGVVLFMGECAGHALT